MNVNVVGALVVASGVGCRLMSDNPDIVLGARSDPWNACVSVRQCAPELHPFCADRNASAWGGVLEKSEKKGS